MCKNDLLCHENFEDVFIGLKPEKLVKYVPASCN